MWWTPEGERILQGAEAELFRTALGFVADHVRDDNGDWEFGIPAFDGLQHGQKLSVLAQIGRALLYEDEPMPRLTAVLEAAVAVMYEYMEDSVKLEIDCPELSEDHLTWRELVLTVCRETGMEEDDELPDADSDQVGEWEVLIQCLSDRVLWDNDWMDGDLFLDSDPVESGVLKRLHGIDDDYYTAIPPDCTGEELDRVRAILRELTRGQWR